MKQSGYKSDTFGISMVAMRTFYRAKNTTENSPETTTSKVQVFVFPESSVDV